MSFILLLLIFKAIVLCCPCFTFISDVALKDAVYILFREVVIVLMCILVLEGINYYEVLNKTIINVSEAAYCGLVALFLWTLMGFIFTLSA